MDASVSNRRGLWQDVVYILVWLYYDWLDWSLDHAADTLHGPRLPRGGLACCIRTGPFVVTALVYLRILR